MAFLYNGASFKLAEKVRDEIAIYFSKNNMYPNVCLISDKLLETTFPIEEERLIRIYGLDILVVRNVDKNFVKVAKVEL